MIAIWLFYQERLELSQKIVNHAIDGICITDVNGIIQNVNPAFSRITGYGLKEVIGKTPSVLQSGEHTNEFYQTMWKSLLTNGYWEGFIWNKRKNNEIYKEWLTITAIKDDSGDAKNYVGMFYEVKERFNEKHIYTRNPHV